MTAKEALEKIKGLFAEAFAPAPPAQDPPPAPAPIVVTTADGKVLTVDVMAVGGIVTIDGAPAPDGEYKLDNGNSIQVVSGVIAELSSPVEDTIPEEMKSTQQMMAALSKFAEPSATPDLNKMATILKACFENVFGWQLREAQEKATRDAAIQAYQTGFSSQLDKQKELSAHIVSLLGKFAEMEIEKPAEQKVEKDWADMTPLERRRYLANKN